MLLHLVFRTRAIGLWIGDCEVYAAGREYGQSPSYAYEHALGDEPRRWQHKPLIGLAEQLPPPPAFAELFAADVAAWQPPPPAEPPPADRPQ